MEKVSLGLKDVYQLLVCYLRYGYTRNNHLMPNCAYDKVKELITLPDEYCTTKMVADYFRVPEATIRKNALRHREELEFNGLIILL